MKHAWDPDRSELIDCPGVWHAPENEMGVVLLFAKLHRTIGFPIIDVIQPHFPDCWAIQRTGNGTRKVWIEFEYASRGFRSHLRQLGGLRPKRGFVVCWYHDWEECERYADVIELRRYVGAGWRVWMQSTLPIYHSYLDEISFRRTGERWSASLRARPGDLMLMWRAGTPSQAKRHDAPPELLNSIANVFEVTSLPRRRKRWGPGVTVRQVARLREPLRWQAIKSDHVLQSAPWVRSQMQGRPEVTPYWWRLHELILQLNPRLKRDRRFRRFYPGRL